MGQPCCSTSVRPLSSLCTRPTNREMCMHASRHFAPALILAISQPATSAPLPPGIFELPAGITQLTALRNFALHGNIASLGDLWQHTGLTQLALMNSHIPFPEPPRGSASLPALRTAEVGSIWRELPLFWDGLLSSALRHVTRLVGASPLCTLLLHGLWKWNGRCPGKCSGSTAGCTS